MNIFALDTNPIQAARWLVDRHVVKMVTETAQCLACAAIRHGQTPDKMPLTKGGTPMKGGYHYHPSSIWAGNTRDNFRWLCRHGLAIADEYHNRYGKKHFSEDQILKLMFHSLDIIPEGTLEPFAVAISEDSRCRLDPLFNKVDAVTQYRMYYTVDKSHLHSWKRNKPWWIDRYTAAA